MKERPILFSGPMVRAILEGRKTQTRRILKKQPDIDPQTGDWLFKYSDGSETVTPIERWIEIQKKLHCPYGQPGNHLWVRETWRPNPFPTGWPYEYRESAEEDMLPTDGPWKPSIHMPRVASRILLEIEEVRIERLNDITEQDAMAEGIIQDEHGYRHGLWEASYFRNAKEAFESLWNCINGPDSWNTNPWVWVITFKRIEP